MQAIEDRGPFSAAVLSTVSHPPPGAADVVRLVDVAQAAVWRSTDVVADDDLQLGLYLLYELHYGGLPGVDDGWEWSGPLLDARDVLEQAFEAELRRRYSVTRAGAGDGAGASASASASEQGRGGVARQLFDLAAGGSPGRGSIAGFVAREATRDHVAEVLVLRSTYQLKEADPQTWAIPRLRGRPKAALVEIQLDEYGGGRPDRMHAVLFARCMRALGLDDAPNAYLAHVPAVSLAGVNALSMFGLHRRLRGALCGHLAMVEMTSSLPSKRYVAGLERLGLGAEATEFFDEHVEADAVHEQIAAHDLCGSLVAEEPDLLDDVLLGALVCQGLDAETTDLVLSSWRAGSSALRRPLPRVGRWARTHHPG